MRVAWSGVQTLIGTTSECPMRYVGAAGGRLITSGWILNPERRVWRGLWYRNYIYAQVMAITLCKPLKLGHFARKIKCKAHSKFSVGDDASNKHLKCRHWCRSMSTRLRCGTHKKIAVLIVSVLDCFVDCLANKISILLTDWPDTKYWHM
jgi:hypothetical protein